MKKIICLLLTFTLLLSLFGCSAANRKERFTATAAEAFDTVTTVVAYDSSEADFNSNFKLFESELNRFDKLFDIYSEAAEINNLCTLNKKAKDAPVTVDRDIIDLLNEGKAAFNESNGKINICLGAVLELWHDARETALKNPEAAYIPSENALRQASLHCNPEDLIIDEKNSTVFFKDKKMKLDVGAIAKGWVARKLSDMLISKGIWSSFMLNLGGNVVTKGYKGEDGVSKWNIEIENPKLNGEKAAETVSVTDSSVVTSGDYQRYFTYNKKNYCHIIDPETLMPAEYFSGVTVICADSALADRLSTQLFITPIDEGKRLVEALDGVEALWIDKDYKTTCSSGFESFKMP